MVGVDVGGTFNLGHALPRLCPGMPQRLSGRVAGLEDVHRRGVTGERCGSRSWPRPEVSRWHRDRQRCRVGSGFSFGLHDLVPWHWKAECQGSLAA